MTDYCHRQMKEEEGRHNAAVETFQVAEKSLKKKKKKLLEEEKERKSTATALESAEKQAKTQSCSCETSRTNWPPPRPKL